MMVLVDTSVWSLALRRKDAELSLQDRRLVGALRELIREGRAKIVGPIRQELLSGIREPERYRRIRDELRAFSEPVLEAGDYEEAAHMSNQCRARGISGSPIDFLLCACAQHHHWQIFTTDQDFGNYGKVVPVSLYRPSAGATRP
jgi:predicted nucleic acid-binding protein